MKKTYGDISRYINNKYNVNSKINQKNSKPYLTKKVINIKSAGLFSKEYHMNWLKNKLEDEFIINVDESNPDYLIYNVFSNEDIIPKYQNAIKIAIYTENTMPDINLADYAIGHYHINYLDRYFKYSIFLWQNFSGINERGEEFFNLANRTKFCAALISNCDAKFRFDFIEKLSLYKKVDIGGHCRNNINRTVINKKQFLSKYKFSIAMENSDGDGYLSEKIIDAFKAGTIPIYYGDYMLDEFINPKTYILIKGENDIEKKIKFIKEIDEDEKLYKSILKEKPIIDKYFLDKIDKIEIKSFLKNIFQQDKNKAYRRDINYNN